MLNKTNLMKYDSRLLLYLSTVIVLVVFLACSPKIVNFTPEEGNVGTEVTIKGDNFKDNKTENTVKFSGVTVPTSDITYASETQIKAKVPSGATTGLISVTTSKGTGYSKKNFKIASGKEWTFMVYLDADNNLEGAGISDFLEMSSIGSSSDLNIVVQMDRIANYSSSYGDWEGTKRFLINSGMNPSATPVLDLGEQNMGDPNVLKDFVVWSIDNYPAKNYALVIWNHGDGWRELQRMLLEKLNTALLRGESVPGMVKAVSYDDTDGDVLYMREVQDALQSAKSIIDSRQGTNVKLDIVGFDACLMGMVENAYALRNVSNYVIGSEDTEPYYGWPYDKILQKLSAAPNMTPKTLCGHIVTEYVGSYPGGNGITQAAYDVSKLSALVTKINNFSTKANSEWDKLKDARASTIEYHPCCPNFWGVDLWHFADNVISKVSSTDIKTSAAELKTAIDNFVCHEGHSPDSNGSHGVAIYFPANLTIFNNDPDHTGYLESNTTMPVDFVKYANWDNWLQQFYTNIP